MTEQRDVLKRALIEAMSAKYESELSCAVDVGGEACSELHYQKMSDIIGIRVKRCKKFAKRVLAGVLIAALLLTGCTAYIFRNEIKDFFIEFYEKHIMLTYDNDNNLNGLTIQNIYQVSYIPEGYEIVNQMNNPTYVFYELHDSNGNVITLQQRPFDSTSFIVDSEHSTIEIINYEQYSIYCRSFDNFFYYIWNDGKYAMTLNVNFKLSDDELFKIIDGFK